MGRLHNVMQIDSKFSTSKPFTPSGLEVSLVLSSVLVIWSGRSTRFDGAVVCTHATRTQT